VQRATTWDEFVQRVRRHRPSELLPLIARASIALAPDGWWKPQRSPLYPWALAVAARESIRVGNEHRRPGVTERDLLQINHLYATLYDPMQDDDDIVAMFVRTAYEQFPFQEPYFFAAARSRLLFEQASEEAQSRLRIVGPEFWANVIGLPLDVLFGVGLLFTVGAIKNEGFFDLGWYSQPNFVPVNEQIPRHVASDAMARLFASDIGTLKRECVAAPRRGLERVTFNPLRAHPFINWPDGRYLAPVPQFVIERASASALYYVALEHLEEPADQAAFTDDVGVLLEDYVLRQAKQMPLEALLPAIEYEPEKQSTDVILIWPDFILLIEVKATRLTQEARMGGASLRPQIARTIDRGIEQIDRTAALIRGSHPAFSAVPLDRPIYGLVVTLEPYYFLNTLLGREELAQRSGGVPASVLSIQDFERLVANGIAGRLTDAVLAPLVADGGLSWGVDELIRNLGPADDRNPLLDNAFRSLPFNIDS
jgi:hypothetical protein